jgi:hypothetical protein
MRPQRKVFTPAVVDTVRALAGQGKRASEIAEVIGSTPASVRVKCCQLKIKLTRRGRPKSRAGLRDIRGQKLTIYARPAVYSDLKRKGRDMQKSASELAGLLLEAIVSSNLYEAVLDDGD